MILSPVIAPSILSADLGNISLEIDRLKQAGACWIHLDVMDGRFVQNITFGAIAMDSFVKPDELIDISKKYSKTPAQIILRWLNQQNWIAIPKSSNKKRLIENLNIFDFTIDENDMNSLHKLDKNYRVVPSALGTFHQIDLPSRHTKKGLELI